MVNVIGVLTPSAITMAAIWYSNGDTQMKATLTGLCAIQTLIRFDLARPGHTGVLYKPVNKLPFEVSELIISLIVLVPMLLFVVYACYSRAWVPLIPGVLFSVVPLIEVISNVRDVVHRGKGRKP